MSDTRSHLDTNISSSYASFSLNYVGMNILAHKPKKKEKVTIYLDVCLCPSEIWLETAFIL